MALTGQTSADDAERQLQEAIDLGELTAQHAPAGHAIFTALERARADLASVQDEESSIGPALVPGSRTYTEIDGAIEGIYDAAADVRNVPDVPLPSTLFAFPRTSIPWIPIAAGGAALVLGWYLFRKPASSSRRSA